MFPRPEHRRRSSGHRAERGGPGSTEGRRNADGQGWNSNGEQRFLPVRAGSLARSRGPDLAALPSDTRTLAGPLEKPAAALSLTMGEEGGGRSCGVPRDLKRLKQQAMAYYQENDVPRRLEELLNTTFYLQPADVYGHLANYFSKLAKPPSICRVVGKIVLDGLGFPTLQVDISCTVQNFPKYICSVVTPVHFEVLENALPDVVDAEEMERALAVSTALQWVNESFTEELWGLVPSNQEEVDHRLRVFFENKVQEDKKRKELERSQEEPVQAPQTVIPPPPPPPPSKKKGQKSGRKDSNLEKPIVPPEPPELVLPGSMAIGAVSLAVAKASASLGNIPLYLSIALLKHGQEQRPTLTMPLLMGSVLSCGKSSPGKLNLLKEVLCIPSPGLTTKQPPITGKMSHLGCLTINYDTIEQPLLLLSGICSNLGLELGVSLHVAINCAGHELMDYNKGKYEVMVGSYKSAAEMLELYLDLLNKYPYVIALMDPFRKEDSEQWDALYSAATSRCYLITGSASRSVSKVLEDRNVTPRSHGLIIKHTNQTTMMDLVEIVRLLDSKKHLAVFGSTDAEASDDSLVDLAVGLGARFIKLGGLSRGERVTKYNRLLAIEEELIQSGTWGFRGEHTFSSFQEDAEKTAEATAAAEALEPLDSMFPTGVTKE
ncbi:enolase 4 isoform X3 [Psammomys obesus]|uniref:enolase 4 isoform X3 n=1 Tax=Psammomys obesus TaxID=48139 RepID=UPI002452D208|nr:enolase 4 isoform X3 [Psammomys obesus]